MNILQNVYKKGMDMLENTLPGKPAWGNPSGDRVGGNPPEAAVGGIPTFVFSLCEGKGGGADGSR